MTDTPSIFVIGLTAVRADPNTVGELAEHLTTDSPLARRITSALASSGTEQAQAVLCELLQSTDPKLDAMRYSAAVGLSFVARPTAESVSTLVALLEHPKLGAQALYGLGNLARNLEATGESARATEIVERIVARIGQSARTVIDVLRSLGNSAHPIARPIVERYVADKDPSVRAAAVYSLRFQPQSAAMVARVMNDDAEENVRIEAAKASRHMTPTEELTSALSLRASTDKSPHVRYAAVRVLRAWQSSIPAAQATLREVAVRDTETKIRDLAAGRVEAEPSQSTPPGANDR